MFRTLTILNALGRATHNSMALAVVVETLCLILAAALGLQEFITVFAGLLLAASTIEVSVLRLFAMNLPGATRA